MYLALGQVPIVLGNVAENLNIMEKTIVNAQKEKNIDKIIEIWPKVNIDIENESKSIAAFLLHSKPYIIENNILTPKFFEYSFEDKKVISLNKKDFHHEINVLRKKFCTEVFLYSAPWDKELPIPIKF